MPQIVLLMALLLQAGDEPSAPSIDAWIEQLGSTDFRTRSEAARKLKLLGRRAGPPLERSLRTQDPEVVDAARRILRLIGIREQMGERVTAVFPDADERIAADEAQEWPALFLDASRTESGLRLRHPSLRRQDLEALAVVALQKTALAESLVQLLARVEELFLPMVSAQVAAKVSHPDAAVRLAAVRCLAAGAPLHPSVARQGHGLQQGRRRGRPTRADGPGNSRTRP